MYKQRSYPRLSAAQAFSLSILAIIAFFGADTFAQGTMQRSVRISNDNGNIITLQSGAPTSSYTLVLPDSPNPSLTKASILYGLGNGQMTWASTSNADSGYVLMLMPSGSNLIPSWRSQNSSGYARNDEPFLTFAADNGSLSNNRVVSVGAGLSISNTGVDNGSVIIANTGVTKLLPGAGVTLSDSVGNITISSSAALSGWGITGNAGTTAWNGTTGNFLGTTDAQPLAIATTNGTAQDIRFFTGSGGANERLRLTSTGNLQLLTNSAQLQFQGTSTGVTTIRAGDQGATNVNYTLPPAAPSQNNQVLSSTTAGVMGWMTPSVGVVLGAGTATRIAFWGPGPGLTANIQDDPGLYWDNVNKRISINAGTSPTASLHVLSTGGLTIGSTAGLISNTTTSSIAGISKIGIDVQSTGSWSGSSATNTGLNVLVSGGTANYAALFNGGNVGIGITAPLTPLHVRTVDANLTTRANMLTLEHSAIGSPGTGFGANLLYQLQTTATQRDAASISAYWVNANDGSRKSALTFSTVDTTTYVLGERMRVNPNGYVGVGVTSPNTRLDISGAYATRQMTLTLQNGRNDNIAIGDASFVRIVGPTAAFSVSGIANGSDGKRVRIANITGQDWTIMDSSTYSTLGNRIETNTGADILVRGPVPILDMIYDSVTNQWLLGTLNANQVVGAIGSILYAYKTTDESVQNSAVLQDDDQLSINMNPNETWEINGQLQADNPSNNIDIKLAFDVPANTQVMRIFYTGIQDAGGNSIMGNGLFTTDNSPKTIQISAGASTLITFQGIITLGATAGPVKMRFCQGISNNSATTVRAYSYMKILRIN